MELSVAASCAMQYRLPPALLIVIVPITKGEQSKRKKGDGKNRECRDKNDGHNRTQLDLKPNVRLIEFV
jgi:hypothetical protein